MTHYDEYHGIKTKSQMDSNGIETKLKHFKTHDPCKIYSNNQHAKQELSSFGGNSFQERKWVVSSL